MADDDAFAPIAPLGDSRAPPAAAAAAAGGGSAAAAAAPAEGRRRESRTPQPAGAGPLSIQIPNTEERSGYVKTYTAYIVHIADFGRNYQLERRFDDFAQLHAELTEIDPGVPPMPEKKMWASTDSGTVAERRPAFERILQYTLTSEACVFEKAQTMWKFLEIPPPGVVALRYTFKSQRLSYARQCGKLLDAKYEKEHAYRLAHEAIIRANLQVLTDLPRGASAEAAAAATAEAVGKGDSEEPGQVSVEGTPSGGAAERKSPVHEAEAAALEMLRWAIANGGKPARRTFLEHKGIASMLGLLFGKGRDALAAASAAGSKPDPVVAAPHPQIRTVMNALVKAEGDNYSKVFANFLQSGGVETLCAARELLTAVPAFAEFISKLLWISWDPTAQQAFLSDGGESLGLLSALFQSSSLIARACAGLLLSCLLANELLEDRAFQAAAGVNRLVEDLAASPKSGPDPGGGAPPGSDTKATAAETEFLNFIQNVGQSEERFARVVDCVNAPWRLTGGSPPEEDHWVWACCAFGLWALLRIGPKPSRLQPLRVFFPAIARSQAPSGCRWLAAELILFLQSQSGASLTLGGEAAPEGIVEMTAEESVALELVLRDQLESSRQGLREELQRNKQVMGAQRGLVEERSAPPAFARQPWHRSLEGVLRRLGSVRDQLGGSLQGGERKAEAALVSVKDMLELDLDGGDGDMRELNLKLDGMREVESSFLAKQAVVTGHRDNVKDREEQAEEARKAMDLADKAVQDTRQSVSDLESQISAKQREAQNKRTMACSDVAAQRSQIAGELEVINTKQMQLRERAGRLKAGEPLSEGAAPLEGAAGQQEMDRLKAESSRLKSRTAQLQSEQASLSDADPAALERQALACEEAVQQLCQERDGVRAALPELEFEASQCRGVWQSLVSDLQVLRQQKQSVERECSGLKQQLEGDWAAWHPMWSRRLRTWRDRTRLLSEARRSGQQLAGSVDDSWGALRSERALRHEVIAEVRALQSQLAGLENELGTMDDQVLDALDE